MNRTSKCRLLALFLATMLAFGLVGCAKEESPKPTESTSPSVDVEINQNTDPMDLGRGLRIASVGKYAGIYLEDGSNDPVSDLMMVVLQNQSSRDLQIARFTLSFGEKTAEFEVTNLPAGENVVVLEKNRMAYTEDKCNQAILKNVVFFPESMSLCEDQVEITGQKGNFSVKNITDAPLGEIYVYYKCTAPDTLYGGITYRAKIDAGLEAGAIASVYSTHYDPGNTRIVNVEITPVATD